MRSILRLVGVLLFASWLVGCSANPPPAAGTVDQPVGVPAIETAAEGTRFVTPTLPFGWNRLDKGNAKIAFINQIHDQVILVNVVYAPNRKANLKTLRNHLIFDITDRRFVEHKNIEVDDRKALWTVVEGRLDGAAVKLATAVVRIDDWVYDLAYIAVPDTFDVCLPDFQKFVAAFHQKRYYQEETQE